MTLASSSHPSLIARDQPIADNSPHCTSALGKTSNEMYPNHANFMFQSKFEQTALIDEFLRRERARRNAVGSVGMVSVFLSRIVVLTAGTLYPAYRSYKAVRTKDVREYVKWMMYWIVFAFFCFIETIADVVVSFWLPFYYELKIIFVLWLLSPWTKGASILYRKWVHPTLTKHERDIDLLLEHAKSESYNQVMRLGSRGILCAREIIATAALRGQAQLVQQLQRSYSTSDISNREPSSTKLIRVTEVQEEDDEQESDGSNTIDVLEEQIARVGDRGEQTEMSGVRRSSRRRKSPASETMYNTLPRRTTRQYK
uniref:Receptor expression-enhancing protein n=1 Tax=Setaria digitata TaxID=48799 RepID=A0A915PB09_9BILA